VLRVIPASGSVSEEERKRGGSLRVSYRRDAGQGYGKGLVAIVLKKGKRLHAGDLQPYFRFERGRGVPNPGYPKIENRHASDNPACGLDDQHDLCPGDPFNSGRC
jgi:hypothetical protein